MPSMKLSRHKLGQRCKNTCKALGVEFQGGFNNCETRCGKEVVKKLLWFLTQSFPFGEIV